LKNIQESPYTATELSAKRDFIRKIDHLLQKHFGEPEVKPTPAPLDTLILTVLSQNTSDHNRDLAFADLKQRFPNWDKVAEAPVTEIAQTIRSGGLANIKSQRIKEILNWVKERSGGYNLDWLKNLTLEEALKTLQTLKGVGIKTASVVMCFCFQAEIFPVDVHIHRICRRLELVPTTASAEKTHWLMQPLIPSDRAKSLHLNMLKLGRKQCRPRKPDCENCPLLKVCPSPSKKMLKIN
jgi:endonuclease-3